MQIVSSLVLSRTLGFIFVPLVSFVVLLTPSSWGITVYNDDTRPWQTSYNDVWAKCELATPPESKPPLKRCVSSATISTLSRLKQQISAPMKWTEAFNTGNLWFLFHTYFSVTFYDGDIKPKKIGVWYLRTYLQLAKVLVSGFHFFRKVECTRAKSVLLESINSGKI